MTTPAAFNAPDRIIRTARRNAGLLQEGDDPSSEQFADGMNRLNDMVNLWQTQGLKLWLQVDQAVALTAGKATYVLAPGGDVNITKPMRVLQGYYLDTNNVKRPIDPPLSRSDYTRLSTVTTQGAISSYFVDKQVSQVNVTFWLTPDTTAATGSAHLIIQQQVANVVSLTDAMNFPQEWFLALHWGLASEICTGQPQVIMDRCAKMAAAYREALEDWDVEDAPTKFQPDSRTMDYSRSFR